MEDSERLVRWKVNGRLGETDEVEGKSAGSERFQIEREGIRRAASDPT